MCVRLNKPVQTLAFTPAAAMLLDASDEHAQSSTHEGRQPQRDGSASARSPTSSPGSRPLPNCCGRRLSLLPPFPYLAGECEPPASTRRRNHDAVTQARPPESSELGSSVMCPLRFLIAILSLLLLLWAAGSLLVSPESETSRVFKKDRSWVRDGSKCPCAAPAAPAPCGWLPRCGEMRCAIGSRACARRDHVPRECW